MSVQDTCQLRSHKFIPCQFRSHRFVDMTSDRASVQVTHQFTVTSQPGLTSWSVRTVSFNSLLQIVGNLLYYRYINSAIVAPDAFDIVNIGAEKALSPDQRRNLGSIAKILQFAASNKGVGVQCCHLAPHEKCSAACLADVASFFSTICMVQEC